MKCCFVFNSIHVKLTFFLSIKCHCIIKTNKDLMWLNLWDEESELLVQHELEVVLQKKND